jgi:hypothetical protein
MILGLLILAVALFISAVAAFYSIAGLAAIFAAAVTPIIIMGLALEIGKIAATVWLHKYWKRVALQFKLYLVPAILVLMIITSMGIFGFLSKAHMDQSVPTGDVIAKVTILDEKIGTERANIDSIKKALAQMDSQVDQILSRTTDDRGATKAAQLRKRQYSERTSLQADIAKAQQTIATLQEERAPIAAQVRKVEAEVGPIRYIAALIYGDNPDSNLLERAVRWVIILLVFVFDPLAIVLILAADQTFVWAKEDKQKKKDDEPEAGPEITVIEEIVDEEITVIEEIVDEEITVIEEIVDEEITVIEEIVDEEITVIEEIVDEEIVEATTSQLFDTEEEFFEAGKEHAFEIDKLAYLTTPWAWMKNSEGPIGLVPTQEINITTSEVFTDKPSDEAQIEDSVTDSAKQDLDNAIGLIAEMQARLDILQAENDSTHEELEQIKSTVITDHLGNPINVVFPQKQLKLEQVTSPDLSINAETTNVNAVAGFGIVFPKEPAKGDLYLRVDYLPNKLHKWNGIKWIEVDKAATDRYSYDEEYIKHLIARLATGEYDPELLSVIEQEQIQRYINENTET